MLGLRLSVLNQRIGSGELTPSGIATKYGALHAWSADNVDISGTTTTSTDLMTYYGIV